MAVDSGEKKVKRGELIYTEGQSVEKAYLIKSGRVSLFVERNGKKIEISIINKAQMLGEEALFYSAKHLTNAEAMGPVVYIEIPIQALKSQLEKVPPGIKVLLKGQADELKILRTFQKSHKLENDPNPMPEKAIPRVFASISLTANHVGRNLYEIRRDEDKDKSAFQKNKEAEDKVVASVFESDQSIKISWNALKLYTTRFFMESHKKIEQALQIMTKLHWVEMFYSENDDGIKELKEIVLHRVGFLEEFAEFYQYHLYKGGRSEMISVDKLALQAASAVASVSEGVEPDFRGSTVLDFDKMCDDIKSSFKFEFKAGHINALERKGLFSRRHAIDGVMMFSFDREEFKKTSEYWQLLKEIEDLNEKGFVDFKEPDMNEGGDDNSCPSCKVEVVESQKFCGECGFKLAA